MPLMPGESDSVVCQKVAARAFLCEVAPETPLLPSILYTQGIMAQLEWTRDTWRSKPIVQDVVYPEMKSVDANTSAAAIDQVVYKRKQSMDQVVAKLNTLPPIVSAVEVSPLWFQLFFVLIQLDLTLGPPALFCTHVSPD